MWRSETTRGSWLCPTRCILGSDSRVSGAISYRAILLALSYFLAQGFSLNFHLVVLAKLAMQRALGINLSLSPSAWSLQARTTTAGFYMDSGALMLLRASALPSELFSPPVQVQDIFTCQCILVHLCIK